MLDMRASKGGRERWSSQANVYDDFGEHGNGAASLAAGWISVSFAADTIMAITGTISVAINAAMTDQVSTLVETKASRADA